MVRQPTDTTVNAVSSQSCDSHGQLFLTTFPLASPPHWRTDGLLRGIDLDSFDLITLDVFDTLLMRRCHRPDDVFLHLGQRLLEQGLLRFGLSAEAFRLVRMAAEGAARDRRQLIRGDREVDLVDIHEAMEGTEKDPLRCAETEFAVEREMVLVNPVVRTFLEDARRAGKVVLLLSDMYLGSARIRELLRTSGVEATDYSELLVSSDQKVAKHDGGLFRLVLNRPTAPHPSRILHIGDHPIADGSVPASLGLHTVLYRAIANPDAKVFACEQIHSPGLLPELASLRRVLWQQSSGDDQQRRFWHRYGCCVLGPFLDAYATWICLLYTSPSPRDRQKSRMPSSA